MRINIFFGVIISLFLFVGCGSMGGGSHRGKLYRSFYLKEGGLKYFIKPMKFKGEDAELLVDFNIESVKGNIAVVNFSIFHEKPLKKLSSFEISNPDTSIKAGEIESMFVELESNNEYESRFTSHIPNSGLKHIFQNQHWTIKAVEAKTKLEFEPKRSTEKDIEKINKAVIQLLD
ncbi:hypothetical protein [Salibacter halophilus]|uniref:Lipoprotein n=1 Tax=Salibacter halophilus TaxID=1803916 RepID=A0A6N6MCN9_9FLAO|nr:hypothetical protein [Salibacter halophilus]KAB1066283.1 hypothetical protein F3059_02055 [Salibacter halophilus]